MSDLVPISEGPPEPGEWRLERSVEGGKKWVLACPHGDRLEVTFHVAEGLQSVPTLGRLEFKGEA